MSDVITGITLGGRAWTPAFVVSIDQKKCIGCGRCYKVCPREVLGLVDREEDEVDEDLDEDQMSVMSITDALDCIGCGACARVCPKACYTHQSMPVAA
ncbi:MAG: ferredoxin III, nif-specific [Pseudomonadota bacterium]